MHASPSSSDRERVVTQAQADSCCAASEADDSTPSAGIFSLSLSAPVTGAVGTVAPFTASSFDAWRTHVPLPPGQVPKHLLLSVFLI